MITTKIAPSYRVSCSGGGSRAKVKEMTPNERLILAKAEYCTLRCPHPDNPCGSKPCQEYMKEFNLKEKVDKRRKQPIIPNNSPQIVAFA